MTWPLQLTAGSYKINLDIFVLFAVCGLAVTTKNIFSSKFAVSNVNYKVAAGTGN